MSNKESLQISTKVDRTIMDMMVFPIIKVLFYADGTEIHKIVGTGFFLDATGIFLSARHVFQGKDSALDLEDANGIAVYCVHSVNLNRKMVARHIDVESIKTRNDTDIAAGKVELNQFGKGDNTVTLEELETTAHFTNVTTELVAVGTKVWTVAYPLSKVTKISNEEVNIYSQSDMYAGCVTAQHPEGRDSVMLPWPFYETDMELRGGASGGPVCISGSEGTVFAVNCSSFFPHNVSYVSSIAPLVQ